MSTASERPTKRRNMASDESQPTDFPSTLSSERNTRIKQLLERYHLQILKGCGNESCKNKNCVSGGLASAKDANEAAVKALGFVKEYLKSNTLVDCDTVNTKYKKEHPPAALCTTEMDQLLKEFFDELEGDATMNDVDAVLSEGAETSARKRITSRILEVFSSPTVLNESFLLKSQGETSSKEENDPLSLSYLDIKAVEKFYESILSVNDPDLSGALVRSLTLFASQIEKTLKEQTRFLRCLVIALTNPLWTDPTHRHNLANIFRAVSNLPSESHRLLEEYFATYEKESFQKLLICTQSFITFHLNMSYADPHEDPVVKSAMVVLSLLYNANQKNEAVGFNEFQNNAVCEDLDLKTDFINWMEKSGNFSFCNYPFVLETYMKSHILHIENQVHQRNEFRNALFSALLSGNDVIEPFFVMKVRRDHLIQDTLTALLTHEQDLKKQLRVEFVGEEGVDEGGLRKELMQLIVREIFDAKYGMFEYDPEKRLYWFSKDSGERFEYELIGSIVGLALYNSVLLDCHFPLVVYKKIMGLAPTFRDLHDTMPMIAHSLQKILDMSAEELTSMEMTFQISYSNAFGETITKDLIENGNDVPVTIDNRQEYVDAYTNWLLQDSISAQFESFNLGFQKVCGGPALKLFSHEELDLLISGSEDLDFESLEKNTIYDDGFTKDSQLIKYFWEVIHELSLEEKKKFLSFTTGSDRSPIRGLGSLKFVISRHGGDSDRLPVSHTCFNHLLLPDYNTKEKLKERLLMAIDNSEGFGML